MRPERVQFPTGSSLHTECLNAYIFRGRHGPVGDQEMTDQFWEICGPAMEKFGYS